MTPTVRDALSHGAAQLGAAGIDGAGAQARWLLAHALGVSASALALRGREEQLSTEVERAYELLLARRADREPLQHLLGAAPFRRLELAVGPGVFIPRFETETLVDLSLSLLRKGPATAVDLGAGSGAIALSLAHERADLEVIAIERSRAAVAWLRRNVDAVGRADGTSVRVIEGDFADVALLSGPLRKIRGRVDLVVSNPPYVPESAVVAPEVLADPGEAVFSGADGLAAIAALLPLARALLRPGGALALEHDETHQAQVLQLVAAAGFASAAGHLDLPGRPRFVSARAPAGLGGALERMSG